MSTRQQATKLSLPRDEGALRSSGLVASDSWILFFLLAHIALALLVRQFSQLATAHVYLTLGVGVLWALSRSSTYAAYAAAYVVGAEVFWRMTNASFFWEGGKYAVTLILALSLLHHRQKRIPVLPLFYFLLLLPSALLTIDQTSLSDARELISFNLSGPLSLFVSAWFFSTQKLSKPQLQTLLLAIVAPILTTAAYAILGTLSLEQIRWVNDSMFATSGGFGPNQVSTIMGLGVLVIWLLLLTGRVTQMQRWFLIATGIVLLVQGLFTFSRGGMLAAAIAIAVVSLHVVRDQKQRLRLTLVTLASVPLLAFAVLPALNDFTQGFLEQRFTDTNLTHRDTLLATELSLFQQNLLTGVGPGMGGADRGASSHTEFTRLLAEHGALGVFSLVLLLSMALQCYLRERGMLGRGIRSSLLIWPLLVMTNAAMRLVSVSFVFGLAFAKIELDDE